MQGRFSALQAVLAGFACVIGGWGTAAAASSASRLGPEQAAFFENRVRPVLASQCYECHSVKHEKAKGGLLLDTREGVLKGGNSGPAVIPGKPEESLLIIAVRRTDETLQMPPKHALDEQAIKDLVAWVAMGAPDPRERDQKTALTGMSVEEGKKFWSFQPIGNPPVPKVNRAKWVKTPVDAFILEKLEAKGLRPNALASKRTLLRRVTYDLTGLPPTQSEMEAFLAEDSPQALERVVDRLLASSAYGEQWGRHWLDIVRYADTAGCNSDFPVPPAYKYRNWVINAFNADKPYDQFLREQIAGDLLPASSDEERNQHIIATGYLAIARRFASQTNEFYLTLDDTVDNLGKGVLGLSLGCARCHDHKYDPISTRDYHALYGIFKSTTYTFPGVEVVPNPRDYLPLGGPQDTQRYRDYESKLNELDLELRRLEPLTRGAQAATNDVEKIKARMEEVKKERQQLHENPPDVELAYGVKEGNPADARIMKKGDVNSLGDTVPRGFPQILGGQQLPKDGQESGRRELAQWLTASENPLTARVMANRIWLYHYGKGLVQTPNDFGIRGKPPTHPELLDYLARRFMDSGWSIKAMHRLIVLSSTYAMDSIAVAGGSAGEGTPRAVRGSEIDPNNDYWWRFDRRRLSAEEIRDTLLVLSGTLDRSMGEPHPFPPRKEWKFTQHTPYVADYPSQRRSVYLMQQRIRKNPFLDTWDGADPNASTGARPISTTPLQALFVMNSELVHDAARQFGQRLQSSATDAQARIQLAYELAYGRPASASEVEDGQVYLSAVRQSLTEAKTAPEQLENAVWASYCRVLFAANEFFFID